MTAEIAILNKNAVALAADSAVTVRKGNFPKIFNSANKIFSLSKSQSIGIMIYRNAEFLGIPWETIIGMFKKFLGNRTFDTVAQYGDELFGFLISNDLLFPQDERKNVANYLLTFFEIIKERFILGIRELASNGTAEITDEMAAQVFAKVIDEEFDRWNDFEKADNFDEEFHGRLLEEFSAQIASIVEKFFENAPLDSSSKEKLKELGMMFMERMNPSSPYTSGIVIAGFGDKEYFPCISSFVLESMFLDKIKCVPRRDTHIDRNNNSSIIPFAQREMVQAFMEGVMPRYQKYIEASFSQYFDKIVQTIREAPIEIDPAKKAELAQLILQCKPADMGIIFTAMSQFKRSEFIKPVLDAVSALPKSELGAMAESLVYLTSLKKKITMDAETVGGPIDVAVISKGEGLVWIKRKLYYDDRCQEREE